jgi:hypothetical protein
LSAVGDDPAELEQDLQRAREQIATCKGDDKSVQGLDREIDELSSALRGLEDIKARPERRGNELSEEIARLRQEIARIKHAGMKCDFTPPNPQLTVHQNEREVVVAQPAASVDVSLAPPEPPAAPPAVTPCADNIDIDTDMPYGELEPFGREDTAQELTESSITESDEMVDQLERAEVAEEKRAVFRALTRLRGAAITSFDGVARSQTGNIDEYNKVHKWRMTHPLRHLADEESDISKWAFPDNADF